MKLLHKFYASIFRYFWLPCPSCKQYFGGHQAYKTNHINYIPKNNSGFESSLICPRCTNKGVGCATSFAKRGERHDNCEYLDVLPN